MKKMRVFYLVAVLALLSISIVTFSDITRAGTVPEAFEEYVSEGGYFKVALPSAWGKTDESFGLSAEEKKVYGINILGPSSNDGIASVIAVHYYAPGNLLHKTMERFITIHAQPFMGVNSEGEEYGPVRDALVAGRPAKVFERKIYEYLQPHVIDPKKIAVYERYVVIPAQKGFYVLRYSAPEDIAEKYRGVFEKVISSFEPLIK